MSFLRSKEYICFTYKLKKHQKMKKLVLTLSLFVAGMGAAFSQASAIWNPKNINVDTSNGIRYMSAVDANTVWAVPFDGTYTTRSVNQFILSTNGGTSFSKGTFWPDTNDYNASNISAVNGSIAYVSMYDKAGDGTSGKIRKTVDGGMTWTNASDSSTMFISATNFPDFVHFWDANNGLALGDPNNTGGSGNEYEIWRTNNGGTNWTRVAGANIPNPATGDAGLTNSYTTYGKHIWFGTELGHVYSSNDSGKTWSVNTGIIGLAGGVQGLAFRDSLNGMAWGLATTAATSNSLKKTSNGGITWSAVTLDPTNTGLYAFCTIPGRNSYMSVGLNSGSTGYVTSVTQDDGVTWNLLETGTTSPFRMIEVQMLDSMHGWAGSFSDATLPNGLGGMNTYMGPNITLACPVNLTANKTSMCLNDSITLMAAGASTYSWSTSATTPNVTIHPTASGVYTVTGTLGACVNTQTISITVTAVANPTVTVSSASNTICVGGQVTLNSGGATTYTWSPATGLSASTGTTVTAHPTTTTDYTLTGAAGVCKATTTFTVTVNACTGINQVTNATKISIYPNPSTGLITVTIPTLNEGTVMYVTDMIGKEVYKTSVTNTSTNLDLTGLQKGMYMLTISSGKTTQVEKIVIGQ